MAKAPKDSSGEAGARAERLAAALRANLGRRKAQARARAADAPAADSAGEGTPRPGAPARPDDQG